MCGAAWLALLAGAAQTSLPLCSTPTASSAVSTISDNFGVASFSAGFHI